MSIFARVICNILARVICNENKFPKIADLENSAINYF